MKDSVERLNAEYGLNLSEEEIGAIAKQAEAAQRLFQTLFEVEVDGIAPALKIVPA
jgi:Asp-tRNA(Asn)/Glu-tRNA(Gln) amidotransferase C subunit